MSRLNKTWTADEIDYLISAWGNVNMSTITKHLDRSECAIRLKAGKLNLGPFLTNGYRYITISNLYKLIRSNTSATYLKTSWVKKRNLPTHNISRSSKTNFTVVYIDEFWTWAEKNQYFLDFSKLERYQLGPEPDWVNPKREADILRNRFIKATPWTNREDNLLKELLKKQKYGYKELSQILCRSEGAIQRRINDLNIKYRPVKADNHNKWSDEEYAILSNMIKNGSKYEQISDVIGRSAKAIRGRVFDKYLTENLDKVRAYIGDGEFGDNIPNRPLKYKRLMTDEDKDEMNVLLSALAGLINCIAIANSDVGEEYSEFWQKDMCLNWDDVKGCLYIQQAMRCMRYKPHKKAIIIDHAENWVRFGLPDDEREWSLEGKKKNEIKGVAPVKTCPNCFSVIPASLRICPHCDFIFEQKEKKQAEGNLVKVTPEMILKRKVSKYLTEKLKKR